MKKNRFYFLAVVTGFLTMQTYAQNVAINEDGSAPHPSALLDVKSSNKGILIPRMSTNTRLAIAATKGLLVYDTTTSSFWYNTGTAWQNMVAGATTGTGWSLNGNVAQSTDFLGTINNIPLRIKVKNMPAGLLGHSGNTFWGINSGGNPDAGNFSINTAIGHESLMENVNGIANTAIGAISLIHNVSGTGNTATGAASMVNNTTGESNTASGMNSLWSNTTGSNNTANGTDALFENTTGSNNTAVGYRALHNNNIGEGNTGLGASTFISPGGNVTNTTVVGFGAAANTSNTVRIGNGAITKIEGQVPFTTPSDGRFKYKVQEDVHGLDFILQLRPVTYQFDVKQFDEQLQSRQNKEAVSPVNEVMQAAYTKATAIRRTGFIAQEVEKAAKVSGYDFSGLVKPATEQEYYSISYESFVVPMVKAIQELNKKVEALEKENALLKAKK